MIVKSLRLLLLVVIPLCAYGCGTGNQVVIVPASGIVTYKGQPVDGADVTFAKEGAPAFSYARTNSKGEFELSTFNTGDGAVAGVNVISISKSTAKVTSDFESDPAPKDKESASKYAEGLSRFGDPKWIGAQKAKQKSAVSAGTGAIPLKYAMPDKSGIKFTIAKGQENVFKIDLKD